MVKLSIIIPAYNEEKRIGKLLNSYLDFFSKKIKDFEIIVVLNACKDNTLSVVKKFKDKRIKYLNFKEAIGKGGAIVEGFKKSKGKLVGFVDGDMATPPNAFYDLFKNVKEFDGIIASRWIKGAKVYPRQSFLRRFAGRCFNFLVKLFFNLKFKDTQCGAKLFKSYVIKKILDNILITRWAFDVNLLYLTKINNYNIKEIPTEWHDQKQSSLNIFKAVPEMFLGIIRLRLIYSNFNFIVKIYDKLPETLKIHHKLIK